ncbi:MAG: ABC transporter ATP-binding protein [Bdellovibrionales bacterium]|jgi:oligopeptide/dipeptide ABC transporter ATP-binding protein|nr:ABC transporter ATP-binding protein [Bdellovibrionales bacterium]
MLLNVKNLSISFKTKSGIIQAVRNISFSINSGDTLGIVGESGCGKSITNLAIMRLLTPQAIVQADVLEFNGINLLNLKERKWQQIRGKEISMIFQDPMSALNPCFTVGHQIKETLKVHTSLKKKEIAEKAIDLLEQVGIPDPKTRISSYPHELSGGMAQRVMIAMAIACRPKLLIADEPTTALDVTIQDQILELLSKLQKENNMAMILVTHDLGVVAKHSKLLQVMYAGEIIESGITDQIINRPYHPYTYGLLQSLPSEHNTEIKSILPSIKGIVPDLHNRPTGCQFHPRCNKIIANCSTQIPSQHQDINHHVLCFNPIHKDS